MEKVAVSANLNHPPSVQQYLDTADARGQARMSTAYKGEAEHGNETAQVKEETQVEHINEAIGQRLRTAVRQKTALNQHFSSSCVKIIVLYLSYKFHE